MAQIYYPCEDRAKGWSKMKQKMRMYGGKSAAQPKTREMKIC